jgi:hypothetical protein
MRETTTEGRFAEKNFAPGAVASGAVMVCGSIFVRHEDCYGWLWVVNVQCAASGDKFDKPRCAVVVANIERNGDAVATGAGAKDGKSCHPNDIPQSASLVLAGDAFRHGDVFIKNGAGQKHREFYSGFLRGLGHFNLHAVGDGLRSGVGINDGAEW